MRLLCFGLPGTGKSTFVRSKPLTQQLHLDLGHNAFKSDAARDKFYKKAVTHTSSELHVIARLSWYYDTYAEYFDVKEVAKYDVHVVFAIPSIEILESIVLPRIKRRDGDSDFVALYSRQYKKWHDDFISTANRWKSVLGSARVKIIDLYDNLKV